MKILEFFEILRRMGIGIFRESPQRRRGFLENLVGENPAIVLDTSAIIDLEHRYRAGGYREPFIYDKQTKLFIPQGVFEECRIHNNTHLNSHTKELSNKTMHRIERIYQESRRFFDSYDEKFGDELKFAAYSIAKRLEQNSQNPGEISYTDYHLVGRALELSSLINVQKGVGRFIPSYVVVLTSDHHIRDMINTAIKEYGFSGISLFSTK